MNNRRLYYYPAVLYFVMLVLLWLSSWIMGVVSLISGSDTAVKNLISEEGVRYVLRSSVETAEAAPWGVIMQSVVILGLLRGSGISQFFTTLLNCKRPSLLQWRSALVSLAALLVMVALLFALTVAPWNILSGVGYDSSSSPLYMGALSITLIVSLVVCGVYGFIYGNYRSVYDALNGICETMALFIPAFLAMLLASAIVSGIRYIGLPDLHAVDDIALALCLLPFLYIYLLDLFAKLQTDKGSVSKW